MTKIKMTKEEKQQIPREERILNAVLLGTLCSVAYLAVYFARNILSTVTPQMLEAGFDESRINSAFSIFSIFYAVGQLINGAIGDRIKARYMISLGLALSGITNFLFPILAVERPKWAVFIYAMTGYFLSMIYGPMTKIVSENTIHKYATRCSLGYTFASFIGSPAAGLAATFIAWKGVFNTSSIILAIMAVIFFFSTFIMEKKGIVQYNLLGKKNRKENEEIKEKGGAVKLLIKRQILRFTVVSVITGVIRTTVVFWMPTYFNQYLKFSTEKSTLIFSIATLIISLQAFLTIFVYEKLGRNMNKTLGIFFGISAVAFTLLFLFKMPYVNVGLMVVAIMASNGAATMLWSVYCPSLADTGLVSTATGFLDFMSYMSAAISSTIFTNAVSVIGWGKLILVWAALMVVGVIISIPFAKLRKK